MLSQAIDIPLLTSLSSSDSLSGTFSNPRHIIIEGSCDRTKQSIDMPAVTTVALPTAFLYKDDIQVRSTFLVFSLSADVSNVLGYYLQPASIVCWSNSYLPPTITGMEIPDNKCNEATVTEFDLSTYTLLQTLVVGKNCYRSVEVFNITGLGALTSIEIGDYSFFTASLFLVGWFGWKE